MSAVPTGDEVCVRPETFTLDNSGRLHEGITMNGSAFRVFVADDHALFREGVKALLSDEPDLTVAGEAGTARETLQRIRNETLGILLIAISLPDGSGIVPLW